VITARILAVMSAMCFVLAFALAIMLPPDTPLGLALSGSGPGWLVAVQDTVRKGVSAWVWTNLGLPLLLRPVWLAPVGVGLLAAGAAATLATRRGASRSRHRRS